MKKCMGSRRGSRRRRAASRRRPAWSAGLRVTGNGTGVVAHAGAAAPRLSAPLVDQRRSGRTYGLLVT